jgi:ribosomal protein L29
MKLAEITKLTDKELQTMIAKEQANLATAIIDSRTKEVKNVKVIAGHKKTIARALTIAREREIASTEEATK